jgi:hypothetical protein
VALLAACGGDDLVLPGAGEPATITVVEGDGQSGRVGDPLAAAIVAEVTDAQGRPVVDAPVSFAFLAATGATVAPASAATGADGRAAFEVVLGTSVGPVSAEVRVPTAGGSQTLSATVSLTALSLDANELQAVAGDSQRAPVGTVLADPLVVQVTDAFGNPIPGVAIDWSVDGGGTVGEPSTVTGDDGLASVQRTLGPAAGTQHAIASAPGLAGSPLTFTHVATAGAAASLEQVSGDGQTALAGTALPAPLVVRTLDGAGNPVAGLPITWVVGQGGGTLTPTTSITDEAGLASTQWTLGTAPGANTATAVLSGVGTVPFTATGDPGRPPGMTIETQPPAKVARGAVLNPGPVIQLREPDGSPRGAAGVAVTVTLVQTGATLGGTRTRATDGNGRVAFADLTLAGAPGSYTLAFSAAGYSGARSTAITLVRAATTTAIQGDEPDPSVAGADVRVRFTVQSTGGTPDGVVQVRSDDGASCSGSIAAGECTLRPTSPGSRTLTATFPGSADFEGSSDTELHTVQAPAPSVLVFRTAPPATAVQGLPLSPATVVQLRTATGADLKTSGVAVTVGLASGSGTLGGTTTRTTDGNGRATFADLVINGATGPHTLQFTAPGFTPVTSDPIAVTAPGPVATTTAITADNPDPSDPQAAVTVQFTVTAASGTPTGAVTVTASGGTESCTADVSVGSCSLTLTTSGTRTLTATYAGAPGFAGSSGTEPHTVRTPGPIATTTVITADNPDPSDPGAAVTVSFSVTAASGTPTGAVTVTVSGGTETCTADVSVGSCPLTLTVSGTRTLTASYAGGNGFAGSSGSEPHTVREPPPVPSASESSVEVKSASLNLGQSTDVTVTVRDAGSRPVPGESVTLAASGGGTSITPSSATTDNKGEAKFSFSASEAGDKQLTATVGAVVITQQPIVTVNPAATTTRISSDDPDPSLPGEVVTVAFTVESGAGPPAGTVTVTGGGQSCSGAAPSGSCSLTFTTPGAVTITASYAGGGNFAPSAGDASHQVAEPPPPGLGLTTQPSSSATPGLAFDRQPVVELRSANGDPQAIGGVAVTAALASGPGILVGTPTVPTDADGRAAFAGLGIVGTPGTYTLRFTASGYTDVTSASITLALAQTTTAVTSDLPDPSAVNEPVTVTFEVSADAGVPTGTVTVTSDAGDSCTAPVADGSCVVSLGAAGDHSLVASYSGDAIFGTSSSSPEPHVVSSPPPASSAIGRARSLPSRGV